MDARRRNRPVANAPVLYPQSKGYYLVFDKSTHAEKRKGRMASSPRRGVDLPMSMSVVSFIVA